MPDFQFWEQMANSSSEADREKALKFFMDQTFKSKPKESEPVQSWQRRTAEDILNTDFADIQWVVPGVIPEGLSKIDGGPKVGKSWLAIHLATAVSSGGVFMGSIPVEQREVLYLALEDSERRLKNRLLKQGGTGNSKFFIETAASWKGGIATLQKYLKEYPSTGLVIIDTLFMFSPLQDTNSYSDTYRPISAIQKLSNETGIPIVLIHHTRKGAKDGSGEGWADEGMGSQGINGAVDTILLLKKADGKPDGTLRIKGRDCEETCYDVTFDRDICTWRIIGKGDIIRTLPKAQADVLAVLEAAGETGISTGEIASKLGKTSSAVLDSLNNLAKLSKAKKLYHGTWASSEIKENSELNNPELLKLRNSDLPRENELTEFEEPEKELEIY
jgi:hypothetical protein